MLEGFRTHKCEDGEIGEVIEGVGCGRCGVEVRHITNSSKPPAAPEEDRELLERLKRAREHVSNIAAGRDRWTMRIPAQADDSDLLICRALDDAGARLAARREQLDEARRALIHLDETMVALDHLLRSCRAAGFKGRDAVLMGRAVTRDMAALRTRAARDREALEKMTELAIEAHSFMPPIVRADTLRDEIAALCATEGGA